MGRPVNAPIGEKIASRKAIVGIVGMGYVGLPLGVAFAKAGFPVLAYDMDAAKTAAINAGRQYIMHISAADVAGILDKGGRATSNPGDLARADAIVVCVPTPLNRNREPDMSFVSGTADMLSATVRKGQLIVLESTSYPGTTREAFLPALEKSGLRAGRDFHLAYSPEREDPGVRGCSTRDIPKLVGGLTPACLEAAVALYDTVTPRTVPVSSLEAAEAAKLLENIFRCVNIALVNELKQVFTRMGLDVWEIIEAAKTKPFGFMPFYPGPGLGGHCIPIDPFYLAWKAREYECSTRFIELAGEINAAMPEYVVQRTVEALNAKRKSLGGSRILIIGAAYKRDVDDVRESPSLRLIDLYGRGGATVEYHDPHIPVLPRTRKYHYTLKSTPLTPGRVAKYDAVVIAADHTDIDYAMLGRRASLIIDTRNAMHRVGACKAMVVKA